MWRFSHMGEYQYICVISKMHPRPSTYQKPVPEVPHLPWLQDWVMKMTCLHGTTVELGKLQQPELDLKRECSSIK